MEKKAVSLSPNIVQYGFACIIQIRLCPRSSTCFDHISATLLKRLETMANSFFSLWDDRHSKRKPERYPAEARRLDYQDTASLITAFIDHNRDSLDPPSKLGYVELRDYLNRAKLNLLPSQPPGAQSEDAILIDDRKHRSERAPAGGRLEYTKEHRGDIGRLDTFSIKGFHDAVAGEQVAIPSHFLSYSFLNYQFSVTSIKPIQIRERCMSYELQNKCTVKLMRIDMLQHRPQVVS
jgi:hypothetical protein